MKARWLVGLLLAAALIWPASGQDAPPGVTIHVVQRGENLFRIALRYNVTLDALAQLNGIADPASILVGQRLLVPASGSAIAPPQTHTVQPGETLRSIAEFYGLTVEILAAANNIADANTIFVGQALALAASVPPAAEAPVVGVAAVEPALSPAIIHTVQPGETAFRIATRYGLTVNDLARANSLSDPTLIYAGQQLVIPGFAPPHAAPDLPPIVARLTINPTALVEGQSGRISLTTAAPAQVSAAFMNRAVNVASEMDGTTHTLLVGVPMFTEAGVYPLALTLTDGTGAQTPLSVNIQVMAGAYGSETINLLADRAGLLDANVENAEQQLIEGIMNRFTSGRYFDGPMGLPAAASMTSPFGRKRSYNGGPFDRFHSGTDFAGVPGTPVLAAAPGVVVLAEGLNVRGNAIVIDHGWGVFTGYWHQTDLYVQVGDSVTTGQVIGTIGATGRVTGAHLHWELWVSGVPVDPMQWVRQPLF